MCMTSRSEEPQILITCLLALGDSGLRARASRDRSQRYCSRSWQRSRMTRSRCGERSKWWRRFDNPVGCCAGILMLWVGCIRVVGAARGDPRRKDQKRTLSGNHQITRASLGFDTKRPHANLSSGTWPILSLPHATFAMMMPPRSIGLRDMSCTESYSPQVQRLGSSWS